MSQFRSVRPRRAVAACGMWLGVAFWGWATTGCCPVPDKSLSQSVLDCDKVQLERNLCHGGNVTERDGDGRTPLHLAALNNCADAAKVLVGKGADVNAPDREQRTPLHTAALRDHVAVMAVLLAPGSNQANANAKDALGQTPLHLAAGRGNVEACKALLGAGADPYAKDQSGRTPLQDAEAAGAGSVASLLRQRSR